MSDASPTRDDPNPDAAAISSPSPGDDRAIRRKYLEVESTARMIGLIYLLGCGLSLATSLVFVLGSDAYLASLMPKGVEPAAPIAMFRRTSAVAAGIGIAFGMTFGLGLRALRNWARILTMIFIVFGFVGGLFTQISAVVGGNSPLASAVAFAPLVLFLYFAVFLGKPETRFVYSPEYKASACRTPDIKPSMGIRDWVLLGLYLALMPASLAFQYGKIA